MNKLIITDDNIQNKCKDIQVRIDDNGIIKNISIDILNNSNIEFEYNIKKNIKVNININVKDNVSCTLISKKQGNIFKVKYNYNLGYNSNLIINKINNCIKVNEYDLVNLDGENSSIKYILKTICENEEHYDIVVNHNVKNTKSDITTNGINIKDGHLYINATGYVPKESTNAELSQNNKIINFTNNICRINPNLLIDEVDVSANHSAHISNFNADDLFYLQSRGISKEESNKLLIKGFLNSKLELSEIDYIDKLIQKYWR